MQGVPTTQRKLTKFFILDTNVILHDSSCIRCFADNDIAIPITVLEELDKFKKGNGAINFHAREFLRQLDALTGDVLSERGVPLESPRLYSDRALSGDGSAAEDDLFCTVLLIIAY